MARRLLSAAVSAFVVLPRCLDAGACPPGEAVTAFFAGEIDLGKGAEPCKPSMDDCYYGGKVNQGPDASGTMTIDWDDADENNRKVVHSQVRHAKTGEACDPPPPPKKAGKVPKAAQAPPKAATPPPKADAAADDNWVPPEIPCTILPRLHWEGSDPAWNKQAIENLKKDFNPDEVIDGFDWHVILRFNDVNRCESTFNSLAAVLKQCKEADQEKCHTHQYVKAIEYVGDEPEVRRQSGRHIHDPKAHQKQEL